MNNPSVSGLSDISTISPVSSSECLQLLDSSSIPTEFKHQSTFLQHSSYSQGHIDKRDGNSLTLVESFSVCQNDICEYAKAKLIFECIETISLNNNVLPKETIEKLKEFILLYEIKNLSLTDKPGSKGLEILGMKDFPHINFSYEEKLNIKSCVQALVEEKLNSFIIKYQELGGNVKELQGLQGLEKSFQLQDNTNIEVLKWKDQFDDICAEYRSNLQHCTSLINEWESIKNKSIKEVFNEKAQFLSIQSQIAEVQAKVLRLSCLVKMYKETPKTAEAYNILSKTLDDKLLEINSEIKRKEDLKKRYLAIQNPEYDNILQTYLHLCNAIKKKKKIIQTL